MHIPGHKLIATPFMRKHESYDVSILTSVEKQIFLKLCTSMDECTVRASGVMSHEGSGQCLGETFYIITRA